jgi:hypothetical protein
MTISLVSAIVPLVSKITTLGPVASSAARSDPTPESLRFVTRRIAGVPPPYAARVVIPKPAAPGTTASPGDCAPVGTITPATTTRLASHNLLPDSHIIFKKG